MKPFSPDEQNALRKMAPADRLAALRGASESRGFKVERGAVNEEARTVELAFASEEPYKRWWGIEILDLSPASMRLARIRDGAPLLVDHDPSDHVGVVEEVVIGADRIARARVRFGRSVRAEEVFRDVIDGIRTKVSVGYQIHDLVLEREEEGVPTYRVTDWEPYENSLVSVPADHTVGVGRSAIPAKEPTMPEDNKPQPSAADTQRAADEARAAETKRVNDLLSWGDRYPHQGGPELARKLMADPAATVDTFRAALLEKLDAERKATQLATHDPRPEFGAAAREDLRYDKRNLDKFTRGGVLSAQQAEAAAYRSGMWARAVMFGDQRAERWCKDHNIELRVMTEGVSSAGGVLVPDDLESAIIDLRVEYGVARRLADFYPLGSGSVTIPIRRTGVTAYFVAETAATTESEIGWGSADLVAKEVSALTRFSMSLAEDAVIDIAAKVAEEHAYAFASKEDSCLIDGDGTSPYGGIVGLKSKLETASMKGIYTAATNTDSPQEVISGELSGVMSKLPSYARRGAVWVSSPAFDELIFGRLMAAAGGNTTVTLAGEIMQAYLGRPRVVCEPCYSDSTADLTGKAMAFYGNFKQGVAFGERRGITVQVLRERYAEYRQIGVIGTERIDINAHGVGDTTVAGPIVALIGG